MADGSLPVQFRVVTPGDRDDLEARMARNDARSLPEAVQARCCVIVGSGPSARHEALWDFLDANPGMITVACNGALSLFLERGKAPTYWTCCDPQDEVLDFLPRDPPQETTYLVATKCPESLFDRLAAHDVRPWRLDDMATTPDQLAVTCAVSVTLVTQSLMRFMGFHQFEMFGWDCCYLDGEHHASKQPRPIGCLPFVIEDSSPRALAEHYQSGFDFIMHRFEVAPSWAAELNDACIQSHNLRAMGYKVNVHGPGAVGTLLRAKRLIA